MVEVHPSPNSQPKFIVSIPDPPQTGDAAQTSARGQILARLWYHCTDVAATPLEEAQQAGIIPRTVLTAQIFWMQCGSAQAPATPLEEAQQAGISFQTMPKLTYPKLALKISDRIALLLSWDMIIPDMTKAELWLRRVGFHRLSGYWAWFQHRDRSKRHWHFRPGTSFESVLMLYDFDRRLRLIIIDALEKIEVAARVAITDAMDESYGPH